MRRKVMPDGDLIYDDDYEDDWDSTDPVDEPEEYEEEE